MNDRLVFPYIVLPQFERDHLARPYLPVTIRYRQNEVQTVALLDSGADANVLPLHLGLELGANWDRQPETSDLEGIGGGGEAKWIGADLQVESWPSIRLIFAWANDNDVPVILGQWNFFEHVDVCFFRSQKRFELDLKSNE